MIKKLKNKSTFSIVLVALILIIASIFLFFQLRPHPLGVQTEYLGKTTGGSWLPMSSMEPIDRYYYSTDLTPEELASYFKADISGTTGDPDSSAYFYFKLASGKESTVRFYKNKNDSFSAPPDWAKNTTKKYFFYILDQEYETLRHSL